MKENNNKKTNLDAFGENEGNEYELEVDEHCAHCCEAQTQQRPGPHKVFEMRLFLDFMRKIIRMKEISFWRKQKKKQKREKKKRKRLRNFQCDFYNFSISDHLKIDCLVI